MPLPSVVELAHRLVSDVLRNGDTAVDATVGNGHDTLVLARCVGAEGKVYGFDVQEAALAATRDRLEQEVLSDRAELFLAGHERMLESLPGSAHGVVRAVMFNLGYLPGADKSVITTTETTLAALKEALDLLAPGGLVTLVAYPGHPGGAEEASAVEAFLTHLPRAAFTVYAYAPVNAALAAPRLLAAAKVE